MTEGNWQLSARNSETASADDRDCEGRNQARVGPHIIGLYALANIGAFIAFIPFLQILVPLRAYAIDSAHGAVLLSRVFLVGALVASLANIAFGALSDRTQNLTGGRRPWLLAGLAGILLSYWVVRRAETPVALLFGTAMFQLTFNAMFSPLTAILSDRIPAAQRGLMSALLGLGYPVGNLIGTQVVGRFFVGESERFYWLGMLVCALIIPFIVQLGNAAPQPVAAQSAAKRPRRVGMTVNPFASKNFTYALVGRVLVVTAFSLVQGYLLLHLRHLSSVREIAGGHLEAAFAVLATIMACASGICAIIGGVALDRLGHGGAFVFASAVGLAFSIATLGYTQAWLGLQAASLLYGGAAGIFYATDLAFIVQVLPSLKNVGRDLGVVNLSNTIPQVMAPLIALAVLTETHESFRLLFLLAAASALLGAACILGVRIVSEA